MVASIASMVMNFLYDLASSIAGHDFGALVIGLILLLQSSPLRYKLEVVWGSVMIDSHLASYFAQ